MFEEKLKTIIDFVYQYNHMVDDYCRNTYVNDEIQTYFSVNYGLLDILTNKLIQDYIRYDHFETNQKKELVYYDQEYKIKIPLSKIYSYILYNIKTNKLELKKGIEIKNYFVIAENIDYLFKLLADDESKNIIIMNSVLTNLFIDYFIHKVQDLSNEYYSTNIQDMFNQLINEKNIYLPIIIQSDSPNDLYSYDLILIIEHVLVTNDQVVDVDDELSTHIIKIVNDIKHFVFKYFYENNLSKLIKYFTIINTEPTLVSIKSLKTATSLKLLLNFDNIKELLYLYFVNKIMVKI